MTKDQFIEAVIREHEERFGRLDENRLDLIVRHPSCTYIFNESR